jgi:hypothetical protein
MIREVTDSPQKEYDGVYDRLSKDLLNVKSSLRIEEPAEQYVYGDLQKVNRQSHGKHSNKNTRHQFVNRCRQPLPFLDEIPEDVRYTQAQETFNNEKDKAPRSNTPRRIIAVHDLK